MKKEFYYLFLDGILIGFGIGLLICVVHFNPVLALSASIFSIASGIILTYWDSKREVKK